MFLGDLTNTYFTGNLPVRTWRPTEILVLNQTSIHRVRSLRYGLCKLHIYIRISILEKEVIEIILFGLEHESTYLPLTSLYFLANLLIYLHAINKIHFSFASNQKIFYSERWDRRAVSEWLWRIYRNLAIGNH